MRRYGRFQGLLLSLGWAGFYRDVAKNWRGIGLLYLLLVLALTWIPILAKWQSFVAQKATEELPKMLVDFPEASIKGGKVSSPAPQPLIVKDEKGNAAFILDTTGKFNSLDPNETTARFLLTETKFIQRDGPREQITDLKDFPWDITVSKENLVDLAKTGASWLGVACFPFVVAWSLIGWLILILLAGAISMAANGKSRLPFGAVLRLAAVGATLAIYFETAAIFFDIAVPYLLIYLICIGLTVAYAIFGIKSAESDRLADFDDEFDHRDDRRDEHWPPVPPAGGPSDAFRSGPMGP